MRESLAAEATGGVLVGALGGFSELGADWLAKNRRPKRSERRISCEILTLAKLCFIRIRRSLAAKWFPDDPGGLKVCRR